MLSSGVQEPAKHSYHISPTNQPASGSTGHQAQHQPHHLSCVSQVRGTVMFSILHGDLCLFLYFSFPTCVYKCQAYIFFIRGSGGMTQGWRAACSIFRRPRDFCASLNRLGLFQPSAKMLPISYTFKMPGLLLTYVLGFFLNPKCALYIKNCKDWSTKLTHNMPRLQFEKHTWICFAWTEALPKSQLNQNRTGNLSYKKKDQYLQTC